MERKPELDYMNAIACLLVILLHVLSVGIAEAEPSSLQAAVIYFPWRLSAFVVPMFIYTAAVKVAQQYGRRTVTPAACLRYCLRKVQKIYLPYVLWVAIYYAYYLHRRYVTGGIREFLSYVWHGDLSPPFYFVIIIMQFYLLMPLWVWMLRRVPAPAAIGAGLFSTLCTYQIPLFLAHFGFTVQYSDRWCVAYAFFWLAGLYTGKYYNRLLPMLRERWTLLFCGWTAAVSCALFYVQYAGGGPLADLSGMKTAADLASILFLHAACLHLAGWGSSRIAGILRWIHQYSYSVYLSHMLFIVALEAHLPRLGITRLSQVLPLRALVCYTLPFLLCRALGELRTLAGKHRAS